MRKTDVIVVGGGPIGACAARALAREGASVLLLERASEVAPVDSAAYANCGLVHPSNCVPLASPGAMGQGLRWLLDATSPFYVAPRPSIALVDWLRLFHRAATRERVEAAMPVLRNLHVMSANLHGALAADDGERWLYRRHGLIQAFEDPGTLAAAVLALDAARDLGVDAQVLTEAETRAVYPEASGPIAGALSFAEDAHMDPALFTRAIAQQAIERGATVRTSCEVIALEEDASGVRLLTTRGAMNAGQVVLAAGAWTGSLLRTLGVRLPLEPGKGYSIDVLRPLGFPEVPLFLGEARVVLTPLGNRLRLGSTLELAGWDMQIRRQRLGRIRDVAERFLGARAIGAPLQVWRGLRPLTPDGLPLIGRLRSHKRAIIASGHCLIGLSLAPVTGQLLAEIASGRNSSLDLVPLRPDRF